MRSSLEVFDMNARTSHVLWQSPDLFEAPNWHPTEDKLLINGNGRLFWVHLDGSGLDPIDTGFATSCNNDHGISPDGTTIILSDKTETSESCIYTIPIEGGPPTRITSRIPSYWHGWSPDGAQLAYCARRDGAYHIAVCASHGGNETQLTSANAHHDGPDYSPDGQWIWFNSDRSGTSEIWRVRPDGSDLTQMTEDERVNWFPHPSPNGTDVIYLAYPEGTLQHPRDLDVELRRMNADGSGKETLLALFGGQGTINVPCWSPDGDRFAFMRYGPAVK